MLNLSKRSQFKLFLFVASLCGIIWYLVHKSPELIDKLSFKNSTECVADFHTSIIPEAWKERNQKPGSPLYENVLSAKAKEQLLKPENVTYVPMFVSGEHDQQLAALNDNRLLVLKDRPGINIESIDWVQKDEGKYFGTQLHSFAGLGHLLAQESRLSSEQELKIASIIKSWAICNQHQPGLSERAWFEGTVIKRLSNLLHGLNYLKRHGAINGLQYEELMYLILLQIDYLMNEPDIYSYGNHGVRQDMMLAASAIAIPNLPMADSMLQLASERLHQSTDILFTEEGIWSEHAPGYVQYGIRLMMDIKRLDEQSDKFTAQSSVDKIKTSGKYLLASLTPDLRVPWIGASESKEINPLVRLEILGNLDLESEIQKYSNSIQYFQGYGHAIMRGKDRFVPYMIFYAGHNPPAGKRHEDALSFILYNSGRLWFTEGGHNTYEPGPLTTYLRTAKAHNTYTYKNLNINPSKFPELRSGLVGFQENSQEWVVSAFTDRFSDEARVERTISLDKAGQSMTIKDVFIQKEGAKDCFQGYFQFPSDLEIIFGVDNRIEVKSQLPESKMMINDVYGSLENIKMVSGQKSPYAGWGFDGNRVAIIKTLSYEVCAMQKLELNITWN